MLEGHNDVPGKSERRVLQIFKDQGFSIENNIFEGPDKMKHGDLESPKTHSTTSRRTKYYAKAILGSDTTSLSILTFYLETFS